MRNVVIGSPSIQSLNNYPFYLNASSLNFTKNLTRHNLFYRIRYFRLDSSINNSEILNISKYTVRCDKDFSNTQLVCGGRLYKVIHYSLNPIDYNLAGYSNFKELLNVDIVGAKITIDLYLSYIIIIYIPQTIMSSCYHY